MREMKYSGIEWIGEIPKEWKILRNKNAFTCTKKLVGEKSSETQLLSLTTKGVRKKDINNAEGKLPESFDTYQYVKENNIVMCLFDLDCSAVFSGISFYNGMISPAYRVLTCTDRTFPKYAGYWFNYISYDRKFNHYAKNIRYTLSYEEFSTLPIIFPPYEEQQKISAYLDTKCTKIDSIIEKQEKIIEKLKAYKMSVITEAVTKGLNPDVPMKDSGIEWIGKIPEHWSVCKFKFLGKFINGYAFPSNAFKASGIKVMKIANIQPMHIMWDEESFVDEKYLNLSNYLVEKDNLVFALTRPIINGGIKVAIANNTEKVLLNQRNAMFKGHHKITTKWQYYLMQNNMFTQEFALYIDGTGQQPNISTNEISNIPIPIPSIEEQYKIADYLDKKCSAIDKSIEKKQAIIEKLKEYKKSLIYEVVTGKKEV